jgi:tRNA-splicing ligase RtcB
MMTVLDVPTSDLKRRRELLGDVLEKNTRFGIGASWRQPKHHEVMEDDWKQTKFLNDLKDIAWRQLGTSGSGNHFVEFGEVTFQDGAEGIEPGTYTAVVSHSGSRGPGSKVAMRYSRLASELHPDLPGKLKHLAWLNLDSELGQEYWEAMQLMGRFASANHHVIHKGILRTLNSSALFQVENHHNFAWKEIHDGKELIVHRKGATPAGKGELGYIPGSMTAPGYLVEGLGNDTSLRSASHGAGRKMSRKKAKNTITRHALKGMLKESGVELLSAGLDEAPHAYKDIDEVMKSQHELVRKIAKFQPRIVKMAPEGERPED